MEVRIRAALDSDIPYLYEICLKTGDSGKDASSLYHDPCLLGQYYAAPYLFYDKSLCFAVEQDGIPRGYILAAADTAAFNRWMEAEWLPPLRRRYAQPFPVEKIHSPHEARLIETIRRVLETTLPSWLADYPAHFHIDLLPQMQGAGWGRKLMERLEAELRARKVPGVHLGVGAANTGAAAFYRKLGYFPLVIEDWGVVMGKSL
jgi:ribosomal protein S18 acetylase RimI-like enzyme